MQAPGFLGGSTEKALEQAEEIRKRNALRGYLELGALYEREKKLADAEKAYIGAAKESPSATSANIASVCSTRTPARSTRRSTCSRQMIAANPSEFGALFQIGKTGAMSGQRLDRAADALEAYLQTTPGRNDPSLAAAHWRLGMVHEKRQDRPRAKTEYESALRLDPTFKQATESLKKLT